MIPGIIAYFKIQEKEMILEEFLCYCNGYKAKNG